MVINKLTMNIKTSLGRVSNTANQQQQQMLGGVGAGGEQEILATNIKNPGERDILLGRGRTSWSHSGNQQFRSFVGLYLKQYTEATSRNEKTKTVELIYDELIKQGGRFLKLDSSTNTWYQVGKSIAREKIAHALRDAIGLRIKLTPTTDETGAASTARSSTKSTSRSSGASSSRRGSASGASGSVFTKQPKFIQPDESLFVHDNPTPDESISCEKSGSANTQQFTTSEAAEALIEGPDSNMFRKTKRGFVPPGTNHHGIMDTMLDNYEHHHAPPLDDDSDFGDLKNTNRTITSMDDELSTGFSAMSLDNKSTRSGLSFKSGKSGGTMSAASRNKSASSAVFELCDDFQSTHRFHPVMNAPIIQHSPLDHHEGAPLGVYHNQAGMVNGVGDGNPTMLLNHPGNDTMLALQMSLAKREQEALMRHRAGGGAGGRDDFLECDIFDGMSTTDDLSAMGSLDEFSFASKSRASTTGGGGRKAYFEENMSHQEDTSEKSSETEREWRKTLLALRENA